MSAVAASPTPALRVIAADIKVAHSVFALPFALLAAFLAAATPRPAWDRFAGQLLLIVLAMVAARTVAMLANRWLDRDLDGANPRTAGRALPSGRLRPRTVLAVAGAGAVTFLAACAGFGVLWGNWWPLALALPVLAWISAYALLKRWTVLCHAYLGASLAMSPLAAAVAVEPSAVADMPALWLLAGMVLCWVAGFDIIYALQDVDVDRAQGLHSLPSRLGTRRALRVSLGLHATAVAMLVAAAVVDDRLEVWFAFGILVVAALLAWEHATVRRWGTSRIALAFLTLNGVISCVLGVLGSIDAVW